MPWSMPCWSAVAPRLERPSPGGSKMHSPTLEIADSVRRVNPAIPIGLSTLVKMAFDGADLTPVWNTLVDRVNNDPRDAAALIDLATIAHIAGRPDDRIALQNGAFELQRVYRQPPKICDPDGIRLLAFMVPGNF